MGTIRVSLPSSVVASTDEADQDSLVMVFRKLRLIFLVEAIAAGFFAIQAVLRWVG